MAEVEVHLGGNLMSEAEIELILGLPMYFIFFLKSASPC